MWARQHICATCTLFDYTKIEWKRDKQSEMERRTVDSPTRAHTTGTKKKRCKKKIWKPTREQEITTFHKQSVRNYFSLCCFSCVDNCFISHSFPFSAFTIPFQKENCQRKIFFWMEQWGSSEKTKVIAFALIRIIWRKQKFFSRKNKADEIGKCAFYVQ